MLASLHAVTPENKTMLGATARCIQTAENSLGRLTRGQRRDLLLDNFSWIRDPEHAERVLAAVENMYPVLKEPGPAV